MKEVLKSIINAGVDPSNAPSLNSELKKLNLLCLNTQWVHTALTIIALFTLEEHRIATATLWISHSVILGLILLLNKIGTTFLARQIFLFDVGFILSAINIYYGAPSGFSILPPVAYMIILLLFKRSGKSYYISVLIYLAISACITFYLHESGFSVANATPMELQNLRVISYLALLGIVISGGWALYIGSQKKQKRIEANIQNLSSQAMILQTISSNVDEGFFKSSFVTGLEFINEGFAKMFGYSSTEEMMNIDLYDLYYSREGRNEMLDKIKNETSIHNVLVKYKKKNGAPFYGRLSSSLVNQDGKEFIVGIISDITQQHEQNELLRLNEQRLKEAQSIGKIGNFQFTDESYDIIWSKETFIIHGYEPDSPPPSPRQFSNSFENLDFFKLKHELERCKSLNEPSEIEGWYITPSKEKKFILYRTRFVSDPDGQDYWVGTAQDITERKKMEAEVEGNTHFYETILNNAPLEIVLLNKKYEYVFLSEQAVKNPERRRWLIGKTDFDYCKLRNHPIELAEQRKAYMDECVRTNSVVRWEEEMIDEYGRKNYIFKNVSPIIDAFDGEDYLVVFGFNISRLKESQISLEKTISELTKLNEELDRFVYSISHDLRAPIASVIGLISLAEEAEDANETQVILGMQREALDRLDIYIRDVIDYSRNKRIDPKALHLDVEQMVENSLINLAYLPTINQIEFFKEFENGTDLWSDQLRVRIIINNLLSNAIKYLDVKKENPYIRIATFREKHGLKIIVQDNGIGVDEQYIPRIWEMFYRGTSESNGSGLGLYILKESLKKLGGSVTLETKLGEGTTFTVYIPDLTF